MIYKLGQWSKLKWEFERSKKTEEKKKEPFTISSRMRGQSMSLLLTHKVYGKHNYNSSILNLFFYTFQLVPTAKKMQQHFFFKLLIYKIISENISHNATRYIAYPWICHDYYKNMAKYANGASSTIKYFFYEWTLLIKK